MNGLAAWCRYWKVTDSGSVAGQARFRGGNLRARMYAAPERVGPDDFRLLPDSGGYRAGEGAKDLGADVDLVGPGAAYQQWLKETGQGKK